MSYGLWGSRFPLINVIASRSLFLVVAGRLSWLKVKNRVRGHGKCCVPISINNEHASRNFEAWLAKGFEKLNIGGGRKNLSGFVNVDFVTHPGVQREVVANILDLGFIPACSLSHVHSNHVIEHLTEDDLKIQLSEYWRILKNGGLLTIRCPNALGVAYGFWFDPILEDERKVFVELGFPEEEDFSNPADTWAHKDIFGFIHWIYGDVGNIENQHLNIITPTKLKKLLEYGRFEIVKMSNPEALNLVVIAKKPAK